MQRIQTFRNNPRYAFMFENANVGGDTMAEIISNLFRLPANGKPMTVMQLAGFPAEVVDSVVSVLCRMAFDFGLWSDGVAPLLFICEEAHRYASSAEAKTGFGPTRRALSRIAKEGRKYGVYLGLVTQRPYEIDPNIISQCNTHVRDAARQRPRPGADPLGDLRRGIEPADLRAVAWHRRSIRIRLRRGIADADDVQQRSGAVPSVERCRTWRTRPRRCRSRPDRVGRRSLAQRDHESEAL